MKGGAKAGPPVRDAATIILWRQGPTGPDLLMGQRGAGAAFMPNKMVFPGGAVEEGDAGLPGTATLHATCHARLAEASAVAPDVLAAAAIRELWEETGLALGAKGPFPDPPANWARFAALGLRPDAAALTFVFRAITPPGRPRRFDARFFLAHASAIHGDAEDFSGAEDELSGLRWIGLEAARGLDLPFITEVVLAEIAAQIGRDTPPERVPFFRNDDEESLFRWIEAGRSGPAPQAAALP